MSDIIKAVIIAIVQGVTEFLPVSSSGHILLLKNLLNFEVDTTFDIILHFGTLIAVLIFYRIEIYELITGLFKPQINSSLFGDNLTKKEVVKIWLFLIIATIPGGLAGIFLDKYIDIEPSQTSKWMFLVLAVFFFITMLLILTTVFIKNKNQKSIRSMKWYDALIIGLFQALAILPGVSRSGSTITASLHRNLESKDAARFSFLMSIPIIFAAFILHLFKLIKNFNLTDINYIHILLIGLIVSFIVGYISIKLLINVIKRGKLWYFAVYMIIPIALSIYFYIR